MEITENTETTTTNPARFDSGLLIHSAGSLDISTVPVEATGAVLLRLTNENNALTLCDTPENLQAMLESAVANVVEHLPQVGQPTEADRIIANMDALAGRRPVL